MQQQIKQGYLVGNVPMILKALKFVEKAHKDQKRKKSGDPYFWHPIMVAFIVTSFKKSSRLAEIIVAAILHDVIEDTNFNFNYIQREFSPFVASLVLELTNNMEEIERIGKFEYLKKKLIGISGYALIIKLADRLHNISDNPTNEYVKDTIRIMRHLKNNRKLTSVQTLLVLEIEAICKLKLKTV